MNQYREHLLASNHDFIVYFKFNTHQILVSVKDFDLKNMRHLNSFQVSLVEIVFVLHFRTFLFKKKLAGKIVSSSILFICR
jgi:hypothetical protein